MRYNVLGRRIKAKITIGVDTSGSREPQSYGRILSLDKKRCSLSPSFLCCEDGYSQRVSRVSARRSSELSVL